MLVTVICIVTIAAQDTVFKEPEWRNVLVAGDLRGKKCHFQLFIWSAPILLSLISSINYGNFTLVVMTW